jgi:protein-disulfide isomerase
MTRGYKNVFTINRVVVILLTATVGLQIAILLKQWMPRNGQRPQTVRDAPEGTRMPLAGLPIKGNLDSRLVLIEFSDYECPYCAKHGTGSGLELDKKYVATGKIRYAFANNPLPSHPNARLLAIAANCAGLQNRYWEAHDSFFQVKPRSRPEIMKIASSLVSDVQTFDRCLDVDNSEIGERIEEDLKYARQFNLGGTPSFAVGWIDEKNAVVVSKFIAGAQSLRVFEAVIEELLQAGPPKA